MRPALLVIIALLFALHALGRNEENINTLFGSYDRVIPPSYLIEPTDPTVSDDQFKIDYLF